MLSTITSPVVRVEGSKIKSVRLSPPRRSPSPEASVATSNKSSEPSHSGDKTYVVDKVLVPQGKAFSPRREKPIVHSYLAQQQNARRSKQDERHGRVILHRFQTENGDAVFVLGTRSDGTVTRDAEDIPMFEILKYVTIDELFRFENESYEEEAEKERIRILNMRPRGRPRKNVDGTAPVPVPKPPPAVRPGGYADLRDPNQPKKRGRPLGWRKNAVVSPPKASVPSFNGPQPTGESVVADISTREHSHESSPTPHESPMDIQNRTGIYSMVAASKRVPIPAGNEPASPTPSTDQMEIDDSEAETPSEQSPTRSISETPNSQRSSPLPEAVSLLKPAPKEHSTPKTSTIKLPIKQRDHEKERANLVRAFNQPKQVSSQPRNEAASLLQKFSTKFNLDSSRPAPKASSSDTATSPSSAAPVPSSPHAPKRPPQTDTASAFSTAPPQDRTPARLPPKRKSLTPHFPGGGGKIPRRSGNFASFRHSPVTARKILTPVRPSTAHKVSQPRALPLLGTQSRISPYFKESRSVSAEASKRILNKAGSGRTDVVCISSGSADETEEIDDDEDNDNDIDDNGDDDNESSTEEEEEEENGSADAFVGVETTNIDPRLARAGKYTDRNGGEESEGSEERLWDESEEEDG